MPTCYVSDTFPTTTLHIKNYPYLTDKTEGQGSKKLKNKK